MLPDPGIRLYPPLAPLTPETTDLSAISRRGRGFDTARGGAYPRSRRFRPPVGRSCRYMEGFLNWVWDHLFPACDGTSLALWPEYSYSAPTFYLENS